MSIFATSGLDLILPITMVGAQAELVQADCIEALRGMADASVDSIVTDPPYELGFMGKSWDASGIAYNVDMWREALRVLKPGGHLLAFSGSRTYHRMTCAIEDAGFEIRDQIMWVYGSGFPKSLDVSKAIDKAVGAQREMVKPKSVIGHQRNIGNRRPYMDDPDHMTVSDQPASDAARQWEGWGTALKPAHEPICVARKPLVGTVAANVLAHGTGAINIDGCRVSTDDKLGGGRLNGATTVGEGWDRPWMNDPARRAEDAARTANKVAQAEALGRWPANLIHDGSDEVVALFPDSNGSVPARMLKRGKREGEGWGMADEGGELRDAGSGSAARFFYCAKASKSDRGADNTHPTVKPTELMRYLVRLVTPPGGLVLDPFMGSGSTGKAAVREGFRFVGIDLTPEYVEIAADRIALEAL